MARSSQNQATKRAVHTENSIHLCPVRFTLLLPAVFLTRASVPFLHVADFKDIRRGWDLRDTQGTRTVEFTLQCQQS